MTRQLVEVQQLEREVENEGVADVVIVVDAPLHVVSLYQRTQS